MFKPIHLLFAALLIGIAPKLGAQAAGQQLKVTPSASYCRTDGLREEKGQGQGSSPAHPPASVLLTRQNWLS